MSSLGDHNKTHLYYLEVFFLRQKPHNCYINTQQCYEISGTDVWQVVRTYQLFIFLGISSTESNTN